MTDHKLGKLYEAMRSSLRLMEDSLALPAVRGKARHQAAQAVDVIGVSIDDRQAQMLDWAEANGYPEWSTVLQYAPTSGMLAETREQGVACSDTFTAGNAMHPKFHDTDVAVINAPNQLIVGSRKDFKDYVLKEAGNRHVFLNMSHCSYFDSSGLGMLFALSRELREMERHLGLFGLNADLRVLFDMARANLIVYVSAERTASAKALQELREFQPIAFSPDPDEPDSEGDGFLRLI